jgi:DNA-binding transcriptional LysR family regulator
VSNQTHILETLSAANQDLAIMGQPPEDGELVARAFLDNPLMVIASPEHPLAGRRKIPLVELGHQPFITREPGSGTRNAAERHFSRLGVEFHSVMEMSSNEAIKQAVEAGLGLGILSLHTLELELAIRRLVTLDVESFPIVRQWFVVHRKGKRLSAVAQSFLAFITQQARPLASPKHPQQFHSRHELDQATDLDVADEKHS